MNSIDMQAELERNENDKQLAKAELHAAKNKWVDYIIENRKTICSRNYPVIVKKKKKVVIKEFIYRLKTIFGLTAKKEDTDGIETYI